MKPDDFNLSPEQLAVYTALQRARMCWLTLILLLVLFAIGFFAFLYAIFNVSEQQIQKGIVGGIDGLLVWSIRAVVTNLFPPPK
jgi:uncharacterized membrane protein YwaF